MLHRKTAVAGAVLAFSFCVPVARADALYVSNFATNTITAYDLATGAFLGTPVTAGPEASGLNGIRVGPDGSIFVAAQDTNNILQFAPGGALTRVLDPLNTAGLSSPQGLTYGPDGNLYVASSANDRILRYDPATGSFLGVFADLSGSGHVGPIDLAFGPDGNLYVTGFDNDQILKVDGRTGAILGSTPGPAGLGFGPAVFGRGGSLFVAALDLSTFAGSVFRYDIGTGVLSPFIPTGAGGFESPGGLAVTPSGDLLVGNLIFDPATFTDTGSTVLKFDGTTGAFEGTLVGPGAGLNIPFFMTTGPTPAAVPEPSTIALLGAVLAIVTWGRGLRRS